MLNHIDIMGRLVRDPELRRTGSGKAVTSFTVAVDRDFGGSGQEKKADFIDFVAWQQTAEFVAKYFQKGKMIVVSGSLQNRDWTDKSGNKRKSAEVIANNCYFGEPKRDAGGESGYQTSGYTESQYPETEAMLNRYGAPQYSGGEFAVIDDDDTQLPF